MVSQLPVLEINWPTKNSRKLRTHSEEKVRRVQLSDLGRTLSCANVTPRPYEGGLATPVDLEDADPGSLVADAPLVLRHPRHVDVLGERPQRADGGLLLG